MNELPTELPSLPEPGAPSGAAISPGARSAATAYPAAASAPGALWRRPLVVAVILLALLLAAQSWSTRSQVRNLREDVAKRLQKGDMSNAEAGALALAAQEVSKQLQVKVALLENRQTEAQSQQLALEQMYQDLAKNRDEWILAEIEQVLSTASQQLQLAGNVPGALIALQNADRSLSRSDKPQFITIRRALSKDTEKLKALPSVDLTGVALRLDGVIAQIDALPMLADEKPALPAPLPAAEAGGAPAAAGRAWLRKLQDIWHGWSGEMWDEVRQLIRVRSVATPDALMLSPTQTYFLRENLKLRLLNARLALLSRNEAAFRSDLIAAQDLLGKYFDTRAKPTQAAQALLRQAQASNIAIEMPTLSDSLNAVRDYKDKAKR